jgi:MAP3K TRAFs-binding domain
MSEKMSEKTSENQPLCFVLMPFGLKPDPAGGPHIDFNRVYEQAIKPGIVAAKMFPVRADEEKLGGIIHKPMFERLLLCEFAVADLTTSNPNVMYELGVRHAARPRTTLTIFAESSPLPFDVKPLRTQPYQLGANNEFPDSNAAELRRAVTEHLTNLKALAAAQDYADSPLFQLISRWNPAPLTLDTADGFSEAKVKATEDLKGRLRRIGRAGADADQRPSLLQQLADIQADVLASGDAVDVGVFAELMLAHRALEDWSGMIVVFENMPESLQRQGPIRQQLAFAYNRRAEATKLAEDRGHALDILADLEDKQGSNPETSGLIGRIHKSQWLDALAAHDANKARRYLAKAVDAYLRGFEADWRQTFPGVNAVTLLEAQGDSDSLGLKERLLPVVRFAAAQKLRAPRPTYWDHATALELAVLAGDVEMANKLVDDVLAADSETWQPQSTAGNLRIIQRIRSRRGDDVTWIAALIEQLDAAAGVENSAGFAGGPA